MKVRAKFTVTEVRRHYWDEKVRTIVLAPQYDASVPEDARFHDATPSGSMEMLVNNPAVVEEMQLGRAYYVDFERVPEE